VIILEITAFCSDFRSKTNAQERAKAFGLILEDSDSCRFMTSFQFRDFPIS